MEKPNLTQNRYLDDYKDYMLTGRGRSKNTVDSYGRDLVQFTRYLLVRARQATDDEGFEAIPISHVDLSFYEAVALPDIYAYLSYANTMFQNGDTTRRRKIAAIRSFYRYLITIRGERFDDPTQYLEAPKTKQRNPIYLNLDEALSLLNAIDGRHYHRDMAIITLFLNCGMRLSELSNLKLGDIQDETLHIVGKGNKERNIQMNDACVHALGEYLRVRPGLEDGIETDRIFLSQQRRPITNRAIENMVNKYIVKAGLDNDKITVHKLRHTAATLMHKYGEVDIRTLQKVLGHENISTTEIYTHVEDDEVREALYKNPLSHYKAP